MDQANQPSEYYALDLLLGRTRHFILDLIALIDSVLMRLDGAPMSAALVRRLVRRALLPAETALRRAILLIATTLHPPVARARAKAGKPRPGKPAPPAPRGPRVPVFRMSEPQPRAGKPPKTDYVPEHLLPRITLLVDSVLQARAEPARPPAPPHDPALSFHRRLQALRAACDDPVPAARRWQRRCARSAIAAARALTPGKIPGAYKSLGPSNLALLDELTTAARHILDGHTLDGQALAPNTS